jgi:hypothetical protein
VLPEQRLPGPAQPDAGWFGAGGGLGVAELGVEHEQGAKMIGVGGWAEPEHPPEPGDTVEALPAEHAFLAKVDRGVRRR